MQALVEMHAEGCSMGVLQPEAIAVTPDDHAAGFSLCTVKGHGRQISLLMPDAPHVVSIVELDAAVCTLLSKQKA